MKKLWSILIATMFCSGLAAQNLNFGGLLVAYNQTGRISKKLNYNVFVSTTIDAFKVRVEGIDYPASDLQLYIQPSIVYALNATWNFAASYTYQRNNPFGENYVNEHRIWQQIIFSHAVRSGRLTHRVRMEERFIQNRTTNSYPLATRARYQIGFNIPLQGKTLDPKEFYLNAYNEFYFSLTGMKNATYSENWSYIGTGYSFGNMGKLELGYLLQVGVRDTQQDLRFLHLLQLTWITNFNCSH